MCVEAQMCLQVFVILFLHMKCTRVCVCVFNIQQVEIVNCVVEALRNCMLLQARVNDCSLPTTSVSLDCEWFCLLQLCMWVSLYVCVWLGKIRSHQDLSSSSRCTGLRRWQCSQAPGFPGAGLAMWWQPKPRWPTPSMFASEESAHSLPQLECCK